MAKLYEIDEALEKAFMAAIDEETGEIVDEGAYAEFCQLEMDRQEKIQNCLLLYKNLKAEAEMIAEEEKKLRAKLKAAENRVEKIKNYIQYALNGEKFKTPLVSVFYRETTSVNVFDIYALPESVIEYEIKPIKSEIKRMIDNGIEIPGADLIHNQSMIVR